MDKDLSGDGSQQCLAKEVAIVLAGLLPSQLLSLSEAANGKRLMGLVLVDLDGGVPRGTWMAIHKFILYNYCCPLEGSGSCI